MTSRASGEEPLSPSSGHSAIAAMRQALGAGASSPSRRAASTEAPLMQAPSVHAARVHGLGRAGYVVIAIFVSTVGAWSMLASINGAVIAPGQLVVEGNVKKVQHPQGGIISEILVREGDTVRTGDILLRMDDTMARTAMEIFARQVDEAAIRIARLEAERNQQASFMLPAVLAARAQDPEVRAIMAAERRLLEARAASRAGQQAQLARRIGQLRAEIQGAAGQRAARMREAETVAHELETIRNLHRRKLVPLSRLSALERDASALQGQTEALDAQIAQAESRIGETELQIVQVVEDHRSQVLSDLRDTQSRLSEVLQRRMAAEDQLRRVEVRAPSDGQVHQLAVHTVGGVVNATELLMLIVPAANRLHIDAKVAPMDYDQLYPDQPAMVRVQAFNQRTTPELQGVVSRLSPDVSRDPVTGAPHYIVRIDLPQSSLDAIAPLALKPGMQADVFIKTSERTPGSFLLKPLQDQFARAFRER